jgi:hypothetical protein
MAERSTDPRELKGAIVGDGGPHETGGVLLDTRNAILLNDVTVSTVDPEGGGRGREYFAMLLAGRINQTRDDAQVLFIMNTDGAAAVVTQLLALLVRARVNPGVLDQYVLDLRRRLDELDDEGNLTTQDESS